MRTITLAVFLALPLGVLAVSYSPNDGTSAPGNFSSQSIVPTSTDEKMKRIEKKTTIQKEEVRKADPGDQSGPELETRKANGSDSAITPAPQKEVETLEKQRVETQEEEY